MSIYKLEGYNSGGYKASREVTFDGKLEYIVAYDPNDVNNLIKYIKVTHSDGTVTHEDTDFLQKLLDDQSYVESFYTLGIEEINNKSK